MDVTQLEAAPEPLAIAISDQIGGEVDGEPFTSGGRRWAPLMQDFAAQRHEAHAVESKWHKRRNDGSLT